MRDGSLPENPERKIDVGATIYCFYLTVFIGEGMVVRVTMCESGRHAALRGLTMTSRGRHNVYVDLTGRRAY